MHFAGAVAHCGFAVAYCREGGDLMINDFVHVQMKWNSVYFMQRNCLPPACLRLACGHENVMENDTPQTQTAYPIRL